MAKKNFKDTRLAELLERLNQKLQRQPATSNGQQWQDLPFTEGEHPDPATENAFSPPPLLLRILRFCLIVGIGMFALANVRPYIDIVGYLGAFFLSIPAVPLLLQLPLIGWVIGTGAGLMQSIFGFILWAILQIFELLPSIMMNNPGFLLAIISFYRSFRKLAPETGDNRLVRQLKAQYNALPTQWIETANHYRAIAYTVDALLCLAFYPPIKGGWGALQLFFIAPNLNDVDWANLAMALSSLFLVEVLYHGYRFISAALYFFNKGNESAE
jgi:hypothetical protein